MKQHIGIAGAGLVGSLIAIYLAKRGYKVSVFERRRDIRKGGEYNGRSINLALSNRGIRALSEVGLDEKIRSMAIPMHGRTMHDVSGNLTFLPYGKTGQYINSISRADLNVILVNEAERLGASFHFEHRIQNVDLDQSKLIFHDNKSASFDMILGADGAFSCVRGAMQITDRYEYAQQYIEHGYKELTIPPGAGNSFRLEKNSLHIWPRESFMLIALPNRDASFTCTLFFPFEGNPSFDKLKTPDEIELFFSKTFPDASLLMPTIVDDFQSNPASTLVTVKCFPWMRNKTLLLGDAAHAIVPFFGQGMNAGFEDCRILNELLDQHDENWDRVLALFQKSRKPDADAIATLALDNFVEMRDLVADPRFLLRKKIEARIHERYPEKWIPLYSMVTFNDQMRYSEALRISKLQNEIMEKVMARPGIESTWASLNFEEIVNQLKEN